MLVFNHSTHGDYITREEITTDTVCKVRLIKENIMYFEKRYGVEDILNVLMASEKTLFMSSEKIKAIVEKEFPLCYFVEIKEPKNDGDYVPGFRNVYGICIDSVEIGAIGIYEGDWAYADNQSGAIPFFISL